MTPDADDIEWQKGLSGLSRQALNERLIGAVESKSAWRVAEALAAGADANGGGNGQPLRKAAVSDLYQITKLLVEAGANVHVNEEEPLAWAARAGNAAIVEYLISAGADEKSTGGRRARSWAEDYKQKEVLSLFDHAADIRAQKAKSGLSLSEQAAAAVAGGNVPMDDVRKGDAGSSIYLFVAGDAGKLDLLFQPKDWVGKTDEMARLWDKLPKRFQGQVDLASKISALGAHIAKSRKPPKLKF